MRQQGNNQRRPRGRANRKPQLSPRSQTFDSNGPDVRVRGNAHQVHEKYLNLARDATASGDRIAAESYYQFAEHYYRLLNDTTDPHRGGQRDRAPQFNRDDHSPGPPSEQPVIDMDYHPAAEGASVPERPKGASVPERSRGPRANGHEAPGTPMAGGVVAGRADGAGSSPDRTGGGAAKAATPERPAVAAVPGAAPEQPASDARGLGDTDAGTGAGPEKRPPAKRRVGRPRRKPANGTDGTAASGTDGTAASGTDRKAEKAEQVSDDTSPDQLDSDTTTP